MIKFLFSVAILTEKHLSPNTFQKMRVSYVAQVYSRTVGSGIETMVAKGKLGVEALATADHILEIDRLFDSFNGDAVNANSKKVLKHPLKDGSAHMEYWPSAIQKIKDHKFMKGQEKVHAPSQMGWQASIKAIMMLWDSVKGIGFKCFNPRHSNQDPLENLFNVIRQNCGSNHYPNSEQFISALKTEVTNGLLSCKK
ncbi:uncharacterized protein LOC124155072 [Ischnura elegans]|uniref:uncharacterized protein LOC124155072 n=1 Tax=Ischnura elegans TaxID=197161 RepID=UPI001ED8A4C4|nr:uncharacterized protein LOC124155072 [Ischnura elegans]